jgi:hypothetical protein
LRPKEIILAVKLKMGYLPHFSAANRQGRHPLALNKAPDSVKK